MSTDTKTILVPPFSPDQNVIVGPFSNEEITTYEVAPIKITINKVTRATHAIMSGGAANGSEPAEAAAPDPLTVIMEHLARHPEDLQAIIAKLQGLANN